MNNNIVFCSNFKWELDGTIQSSAFVCIVSSNILLQTYELIGVLSQIFASEFTLVLFVSENWMELNKVC